MMSWICCCNGAGGKKFIENFCEDTYWKRRSREDNIKKQLKEIDFEFI